MKNILVLATAGAGGDLQPLIAAALGLRERGHALVFLGDQSVAAAIQPLGIETVLATPEHDLGPRLMAAIQQSQGLPEQDRGEFVEQRLNEWASGFAPVVQNVIRTRAPNLLVTSLFGVGVAHRATLNIPIPWAVVNSTYYVGPNPPRALEQDFAPRAVPLMRDLARYLEHADLVLHATDSVFDYSYATLPRNHHYVGPLIWEPSGPPADFLDQPGDPWVLVTLSSQLQDDVLLAQSACTALADKAVRVVLTIGLGHRASQIGPVPPNVRIENYVGHSAVLDRARLLVSHAGHGSVMKALWHGVPMVLVPWGRDQPGVAARAERLGVARVISRLDLSNERLGEAIRAVLSDRSFLKNTAEVKRRLRQQDPVTIACGYLEQIA